MIHLNSFWITVVTGVGAVSAAVAAGLWFWASIVNVPDNIDTFIEALQKIGRLNAYGAGAACVASICGLILFLFSQR